MAFTSHVYLTAPASDSQAVSALESLLSNFAMGNVIQTTFSGSQTNSTNIPCLQPAMAGISLSGQVAGLNTQLIGKSTLNLGLVDILENGFSANVTISNRNTLLRERLLMVALGVSLGFKTIKATLSMNGVTMVSGLKDGNNGRRRLTQLWRP